MTMLPVFRRPIAPAALAVALLAAAPLGAAPPGQTPLLPYTDILATVRARKALNEDKDLAAANVGARVQDGVAVLSGPVPSEALKKRAAEMVKKVKGVSKVDDSGVYVAAPPPSPPPPADDPPLPPPPPTKAESAAPPDGDPGGKLTGRADVNVKPPLPEGSPPPDKSVSAAPPAEDLVAALERVRQSDPRFRAVQARLDGDTAVIRGPRGEDVSAYARAVSRLPGLKRVVVEPYK
jgi:hypothetical protein